MNKTKYLIKTAVFTAVLLLLYGFGFSSGGNSADKSITISTESGYTSNTLIYKARGEEKDISIIALHGKSGRPGAPHMEELYDKLNKKGYTIFAPTMPWAKEKREGTFREAIGIIDKSVEKSGKQKLVVLGHSMGGMAVLRYGAVNPVSQVIGIVPVAPGHNPHISKKLREITEESVSRANKMVAEGKGNERERFKDINQGEVSSFYTTAEYYASFYDPKGYPSPKTNLPRIQVPVLWVAGKEDRNTRFYRIKKNHELIPNGRYLEVDGNHKSVVGNSAFNIADWIDSLELSPQPPSIY